MKKGITQFIPENIPPLNAAGLVIYDRETNACDINISRMCPQNLGTKLYSVGWVSDSHLQPESSFGAAYAKQFEDSLTWLQSQGAAFIAHCGDITNHGFYKSDKTTVDLNQFGQYKAIREKFPDMPILAACGNHDSYFGDYTVAANRELLIEYAGHDIHHSVAYGGDLYIFCGQTTPYVPMSSETVSWLESTLSKNTDKRCFVVCHPYIGSDDSGNPLGLASNSLWSGWGHAGRVQTALRNHPRVMLFHGHSHSRPENQFVDIKSNFSTVLGFPSFSVPSSAYCRLVVDGIWRQDIYQTVDGVWKDRGYQSIVYISDVYASAVVLRAYDIIEGKYIPIAQYCIDTTV